VATRQYIIPGPVGPIYVDETGGLGRILFNAVYIDETSSSGATGTLSKTL